MDDVQQENSARPDENSARKESVERPDPVRLRYWARLIKLLRDPWPPRSLLPPRSPQPPRSPEPTRHLAPARLGEDA
jgi:hypothetical protein